MVDDHADRALRLEGMVSSLQDQLDVSRREVQRVNGELASKSESLFEERQQVATMQKVHSFSRHSRHVLCSLEITTHECGILIMAQVLVIQKSHMGCGKSASTTKRAVLASCLHPYKNHHMALSW